MNLATNWEPIEATETMPAEETSERMQNDSLSNVRDLVMRLLREVQSINEVNAVTLDNGFDFYDEVSRFEIDLIRRALLQTGGHQVRAAKLLNLKVTTLNSKIKHYNISLSGLSNVYPIVDAIARPEQSAV